MELEQQSPQSNRIQLVRLHQRNKHFYQKLFNYRRQSQRLNVSSNVWTQPANVSNYKFITWQNGIFYNQKESQKVILLLPLLQEHLQLTTATSSTIIQITTQQKKNTNYILCTTTTSVTVYSISTTRRSWKSLRGVHHSKQNNTIFFKNQNQVDYMAALKIASSSSSRYTQCTLLNCINTLHFFAQV